MMVPVQGQIAIQSWSMVVQRSHGVQFINSCLMIIDLYVNNSIYLDSKVKIILSLDNTHCTQIFDTTVEKIIEAGQEGLAIEMDLMDRKSVLNAADTAYDHFGRIDVLLNNAIYQGPGAMLTVEQLDDHHVKQLFEGNVFSQLALTRHLLPRFIEQGGATVINMISATAFTNPPGKIGSGGWGVGYAMTKAAFERLAPLLMIEHGEDGIITYNIDPGHVVTERQRAKQKDKEYTAFPSAPPEAIGAAIAWLVNEPSAPEEYGGKIVNAQRETKRRNLLPGWPE